MAENEASSPNNVLVEDDRTGLDVTTLRRAIRDNLFYRCGNIPRLATRNDYYTAVHGPILGRWYGNFYLA